MHFNHKNPSSDGFFIWHIKVANDSAKFASLKSICIKKARCAGFIIQLYSGLVAAA
jgi:hypothetical protein